MRTRTLLGAALATSTAGVLALGPQATTHADTTHADTTHADTTHTTTHATTTRTSTAGATQAAAAPKERRARTEARDAAREYVGDHRALLTAAKGDDFRQVGTHTGTAGTHYVAYERTHRGLPVVGGDLVVAVDASGKVTGRTVDQEKVIKLDSVRPSVARGQAAKAARAEVAQDATVRRVGTPELVVHAQGTPRLAWQTFVVGRDHGIPAKVTVWTDARTNQVIDSWDRVVAGTGTGYYNGTVSFGTSGSSGSYSMTDPARSGQKCGGQNGAAYTGSDDVWGNGASTSLETGCVDAMYAMNKEWDMLSAWLGRSGIKGNGTGYPARVGLNDVNAYWDGSITNFGHSSDNQRQLTAIDIVAHENGHGIFYTTPGGSSGDNETGGMNEATGDIFGALTEAYAANPNDPADYLVGEEANLTGSGPIRNMYNPGALGDPNCWSSSIKNTEVHAAAGPLNHWFYLLAKGSNSSPASPTCNGSTVTGVGLQTAGKIFYNGLLLKTSYWNHGAARKATLQAAVNLYGTSSCTTYNAVKAAWNAVSVPAQSGEAQCGGGGTPTACSEYTTTGSATYRYSTYKPSSSGFTAAAGTINGCLTGPSGTDFDLYLQRWNGSSWVDVAAGTSASSTESVAYSATSGYYRWDVYAYSGSGSFTLKYDVP